MTDGLVSGGRRYRVFHATIARFGNSQNQVDAQEWSWGDFAVAIDNESEAFERTGNVEQQGFLQHAIDETQPMIPTLKNLYPSFGQREREGTCLQV